MTDPPVQRTADPNPSVFVQQIVWKKTTAFQPQRAGRYRIRNPKGFESIGTYFLPNDKDIEEGGWVTMDFDGAIEYWSELRS